MPTNMLKNELNALKGMKVKLLLSNNRFIEGVLIDVKQDHIVVAVNQIIHYFVLQHVCTLSHNTKDHSVRLETVHYLNRCLLENVYEELLYNWVTLQSISNQSFVGVLSKITDSHIIVIKNNERFFIQKSYLSMISSCISEEKIILANKKRIDARRSEHALKFLTEDCHSKLHNPSKKEEKGREEQQCYENTVSIKSDNQTQRFSSDIKGFGDVNAIQNYAEELLDNLADVINSQGEELEHLMKDETIVEQEKCELISSVPINKNNKILEKENPLDKTEITEFDNTTDRVRKEKLEVEDSLVKNTFDETQGVLNTKNIASDKDIVRASAELVESNDLHKADFANWLSRMESTIEMTNPANDYGKEKTRYTSSTQESLSNHEIHNQRGQENFIDFDIDENHEDAFVLKKKRILVNEWSTNGNSQQSTESIDIQRANELAILWPEERSKEDEKFVLDKNNVKIEVSKDFLEKQYFALMNYAASNIFLDRPTTSNRTLSESPVQTTINDVLDRESFEKIKTDRPSFISNQYSALMKHAAKMYYQLMGDQ